MNKRTSELITLPSPTATAITLAVAMPVSASAELHKAITDGDLDFGIRFRLEHVEQDGFLEDALAATARARLTLTSGEVGPWSAGIETDHTFVLGIKDYNSTENGRDGFPIVADPAGFDINQAFVRYHEDTISITVGRQRINHGSQRMVGGVAWRQNEQTYDALRIERTGVLNIDYSYVYNVNRIFGPGDGTQPGDWKSNSHFFRTWHNPVGNHTITGYAYLLDFENDNGPAHSNLTYGAEYQGTFPRLQLNASVARQSDWGDNPTSYSAFYCSAQAVLDLFLFKTSAGYERLGSDDGTFAFRTPLGTLHKFQGWTDKFLVTPAEGIEDSWISISRKLFGGTVAVAYHDFTLEEGGDAGDEVGISYSYSLMDKLGFQFKFAQYWAEDYASDTGKGWLVLNWEF